MSRSRRFGVVRFFEIPCSSYMSFIPFRDGLKELPKCSLPALCECSWAHITSLVLQPLGFSERGVCSWERYLGWRKGVGAQSLLGVQL